MAKHVFRPTEVINLSRKVFIEPPEAHEPEPEELAEVADRAGCRPVDLRAHA